MSNLSSFLSNILSQGWLRDQQHASRLYRADNLYDLAPKAGWLYYVQLNINPDIAKYLEPTWYTRYAKNNVIGLLAKSSDLPQFNIETEVLNQYNRKTVIQKTLNYDPITITFHDDMANATTGLWRQYYGYYFADGDYSNNANGKTSSAVAAFGDVKYKQAPAKQSYLYGLAKGADAPFFKDITIFTLNKQKFLSYTLVNPIIKEWRHDDLDQTQGNKMLHSRMTVNYEGVFYNSGNAGPIGYNKNHYDSTPSPLSIAGGGASNLFGPGGVVAGGAAIFGENGSIANAQSPWDYAKVAIQTANLVKNISSLNKKASLNELVGVGLGQVTSAAQGNGTVFSNGNLNGVQIFNPNPVAESGAVAVQSGAGTGVNAGTTNVPAGPTAGQNFLQNFGPLSPATANANVSGSNFAKAFNSK